MNNKIKSEQLIIEAKKLINVPFCHFGRSTLGVDCSGLLWLVHHRCGLELKRMDYTYHPLWWRDPAQGERMVNGLINVGGYDFCDEPIIGGLVLFRLYSKKAAINHCGILINNESFIHAKCGIGNKINKVTIDKLEYGYNKRIAGYMKCNAVIYDIEDNN